VNYGYNVTQRISRCVTCWNQSRATDQGRIR